MPEPLSPQPPQQDPRETPYQAARPEFRGPYAPGYAYGPGYPAPYPYPPKRPAWPWVLITLGILGLGAIALSIFFASMVKALDMDAGGGNLNFGDNSIAVIDISGVITDADTEKIDKQLERHGSNDSIKAIVLHIDSPGG